MYFPGLSYGERAGIAPDFITAEFATILADDEILVESGVDSILRKLMSNSNLASTGGKVLGIHKYGKIVTGAFAYRNMYRYENLETEILNRLEKHLNHPIDGGIPRASIYRIMRSDGLKSILELFSKVSFVESPYVYEVVGEFAVAALGPTTTIESLYWIRNWQNKMVQHKNWNRSLDFNHWWIDKKNLSKKNRLVNILSEHAKIEHTNTEGIINTYLARRALYDTRGNTQSGNLTRALSKFKQEIFGFHKSKNASSEILQILNQEEIYIQNVENPSIARVCREFLEGKGR
jgi:hypothetical protein